MRARNLKPSIFKNEVLGAADPLYTVVFEGLWCMADREGRLEDRPLRIHAEINPYRPSAGTVQALDWLGVHGFIIRYTTDCGRYISITKFKEHQQPHVKEAASRLPDPAKCLNNKEHRASTVQAPEKHCTSTEVAALTPDSGFPLPDCLNLTPDCRPFVPVVTPAAMTTHKVRKPRVHEPSEFDEVRQSYPKRGGGNNWADAEKAYRKRLAEGHTHVEIMAGIRRYAEFNDAAGKTGTEFVKMAASFLGPNKSFLEPWTPPRQVAVPQKLSIVEEAIAVNNARARGNYDERVVSEQGRQSNGDLEHLDADVRSPLGTRLRTIGS